MNTIDKDIQALKDLVAIPNNLEECQRQLIEANAYISAALEAVETHRRHEMIPESISNRCHYLSKMLNDDLACTVPLV